MNILCTMYMTTIPSSLRQCFPICIFKCTIFPFIAILEIFVLLIYNRMYYFQWICGKSVVERNRFNTHAVHLCKIYLKLYTEPVHICSEGNICCYSNDSYTFIVSKVSKNHEIDIWKLEGTFISCFKRSINDQRNIYLENFISL